MRIEQVDTAAFVNRFHTGQYDLSLGGVSLGSDPSTLAQVLTCKAVEDCNRSCDPKLHTFFQRSVATPNYHQRHAIYDEVRRGYTYTGPAICWRTTPASTPGPGPTRSGCCSRGCGM